MRLRPQLLALLLASAACSCSTSPSDPLRGVRINDFFFSPANLTVTVGTTVEWTNDGGSAHTATSNTGTWDSGQLSAGGTYRYRFTVAGLYPYHCSNHPSSDYQGLSGWITVVR